MLNPVLITELKTILKENYRIEIDSKRLNQFANNMVDYFDLLAKINKEGGEKNKCQ